MTATGWTGEPPEEQARPMPLTSLLLGRKERAAGPFEVALARSAAADAREIRAAAEQARDPDEYAAALVTRGYMPGQISQLSMKLGDTLAELEAERAKIEKGEKRAARVRGMFERGQVGAMDAQRMMDGDFGDADTVARLERQEASLRRQLAETSEAIAPQQQRAPDPLESTSRHAQQLLAEVTRERTAAAPARRPERRPFVSRGGAAVRSENCIHCTEAGLDDETAFLLHSDPERPLPTTSPEQLEQAERAAGRYQRAGAVTCYSADLGSISRDSEIARVTDMAVR